MCESQLELRRAVPKRSQQNGRGLVAVILVSEG
jgi:hypothetical protein